MSAAGPSSAPAPPQPGPAGVTKSVSAAMASGSKPTSTEPENAAAPSQSTSSPLSPLSPRTSMAQAMATNVTASGTTSIPSPSLTAGILPSPALSSPSFPSYTTSPSSRAGPSSSSAATPQHQQQPRSHPGAAPPSSGTSQAAAAARGGPPSAAMPPLHAHLPSTTTTLHMTEARDALVATMSNLFDTELQSRAALLHANASQLSKQEADVAKATDGLRRETDKLAKVARDAGKKIKETGNVQNWAEVLERDFLVLEETLRLAREGSEGGYSGSGSSYWSGSEAGSEDGEGRSRRASVDRGREEGAAVAAKVAGKAPVSLGESRSIAAANEMDIDDVVGGSARAPASSGKTVEEVVVRDNGAGGAEDTPIAATIDVDMDMDGTSGSPAGRDGKPTGEEAEAESQDNGPFSHVDNAIEASIREAMATSMHDDDPTALARSETTLEGGSTSSVHRKAKEMADYDKMDLDASERSFPSTGRTLSRESVSDVASGSGPLPPAPI